MKEYKKKQLQDVEKNKTTLRFKGKKVMKKDDTGDRTGKNSDDTTEHVS